MSNQEPRELETADVDVEHNVMMGEALERLQKNPDFITIIENGYLKEKVLASVSMLAVPQISSEGRRPGVIEDLISASNLRYYFAMIEQFYLASIKPVLSDEEEFELAEAQSKGEVN